MPKFAIEIAEAETIEEAINKVRDAYYNADIVLDADNAIIEAEFNNVTILQDDIDNEEITVK